MLKKIFQVKRNEEKKESLVQEVVEATLVKEVVKEEEIKAKKEEKVYVIPLGGIE